MPYFRYTALDNRGILTKGTITALTESDIEKQLEEQGLTLIHAKAVREKFKSLSRFWTGRIKQKELIEFYQRLSESLKVGLSLLSILGDNSKLIRSRTLAKVVGEIKVDIEGGLSLSQAMSQRPKVFDPLQVGIVAMGEESGTLPDALEHLAEFLRWKYEQKSMIKRASIYPVFLLVTVFVVIGIWVGYVLPQLAGFLTSMGVDLPALTRIVLSISIWVQHWWMFLIGGALAIVVAVLIVRSTPWGREKYDKILLKLPLVGPVLANSCLSRIAHYFSVMLESGMSLVTIFDLVTEGILGNKFIELQLKQVFDHIKKGKQFFEAFKSCEVFPDLFLGAIKTGEQAGILGDTLRRLGLYYDKEVKRAVRFMIAAFEPTVIVILGSFFGIVILAILSPIYDVIGKITRAY